uniref:Peptidase A1 domain-containing protein n=1 Tax=Ursus americanus TaxID=9643 RepID=A0A452SEB9_URSAM
LVDCNNIQNLPTLTFLIGRVPFSLPYHSYVFTVSLQGRDGCEEGLGAGHAGSPDHVPSPNSFGQPLWILGGIFLRSYYSIFDIGNNRVGFATAA